MTLHPILNTQIKVNNKGEVKTRDTDVEDNGKEMSPFLKQGPTFKIRSKSGGINRR